MTDLKRVTELVIDRSKWARGDTEESYKHGLGHPYDRNLKNFDGAMCCLGFLGEACGVPEGVLIDGTHPDKDMTLLFELLPEGARDVQDTDAVWDPFININDSSEVLTSKEREKKLKELFKEKLGIDLKFTGSTPRTKRKLDPEDW